VLAYDTDPTRPIGDWKEAWEKAKELAGAILVGEAGKPQSPRLKHFRSTTGARPEQTLSVEGENRKLEALKCRFHDLRHSAVTRLLEAGIPYPVVASMMGWSAATAIRMAKRYGHIGSNALRDAADVLGGSRIPAGSLKTSPKSLEVRNAAMQ
jgi:integrase